MHQMFVAKLKPQEVREADGTVRYVVDEGAAKRLGSYVNPPLETYPDATPTGTTAVAANAAKPKQDQKPDQKQDQKRGTYVTAAAESRPAPAPPARAALFASASDSRQDGHFGMMMHFLVGDY